MSKEGKEKSTPKNGGEKTLDEKNLDDLSEEELRKAAKSYKGRFEHERKKKEEFKEAVESAGPDEEEEEEEMQESGDVSTEDLDESEISQDPYEFAKELNALKDLDAKQVDAVKTIAKAKGLSPSEARKTDEAQMLIDKYEEEKKKEKETPKPSNKQSPPEDEPMSADELKKAFKNSDKESMDKFLEDAGFDEFGEAFE